MMFKTFKVIVAALFIASSCCVTQAAAGDAAPKNATLVYVGTFTETPCRTTVARLACKMLRLGVFIAIYAL